MYELVESLLAQNVYRITGYAHDALPKLFFLYLTIVPSRCGLTPPQRKIDQKEG